MVGTTQEGAGALKIMKIPLQPGAAQQAALHLHWRVYGGRPASQLAAAAAE